MKKIVSTIIVFSMFFVGLCSAYMEDKVFCTLWKNSIVVTLERSYNYKCSEYLSLLSQTINTEYNNIMSIQKLINQWYDIEYWKEIRDEKREKLKKMLAIKEQIETAVSEFDSNLFVKMKDYVVYMVTPYQVKYKKVLKYLNNYKNQWGKISSDIKNKMNYLQEDILVIDRIFGAKDYDTLVKSFNRHIYLKNQIEWK